jgi:hypothetical protein
MKTKPLIAAMAAAGLTSLLAVSSAHAVENATLSAIKPTDMTSPPTPTEWETNTNDYSWSAVNARLGTHPDRADGVIYIFPTGYDFSTNPYSGQGVPADAVAYVHWALDNDSGEFPGIMAITDDTLDYKFKNCIMASGSTIPTDVGTTQIKTCGNGQGTSKRFKLVVLKADVPVDLHFNTELAPLNLATIPVDADGADGGADGELVDTELFRLYRYLMKWGNGTGTDVIDASGGVVAARDGARISAYTVQVGQATGPTAGDWTTLTGLTFDTNATIYSTFLDKVDSKGAEEWDLWNSAEFATISPSMYSLDTDDRSIPNGGFWDTAPAGFTNPTVNLDTQISSGDLTLNYTDIQDPSAQASKLTDDYGTLFGTLQYYGILSEPYHDYGLIPPGIYLDDDGDPATEGGIYAWWDGAEYRWGVDGATRGTYASQPGDAWDALSDTQLAVAAYNQLDENATAPFSGPKFEIGYADDMAGLNQDVYIKLADGFTAGDQFTIRLTATSGTSQPAPDYTLAAPESLDSLQARLDPPPTGSTTPTTSSSGGGGCTIGTGSAWNITMPAILAALLGYGFFRRRRNSK